jgi:hypothetical protein
MEINDLQQCAPHSLYHNYTRTPPPPSTFRKNLLRSKFRHRRQARGAVLTPPQLCLCRSPFLTHSLAAHYFRFAPLFAVGFSGRKAGARAALTMTLHCVVNNKVEPHARECILLLMLYFFQYYSERSTSSLQV